MIRILFLARAILVILPFLSFRFPENEVRRFYVSSLGKDSNNGSVNQPFATFQAAQKAVRAAKNGGNNTPIEVVVRGGVYYLEQTIEFTPEDGGTVSAPIVWKAADGEKVVLSGGRRLKGKWQKGSDGIWYMDLPETKGWKRNVNEPEVYAKFKRFCVFAIGR